MTVELVSEAARKAIEKSGKEELKLRTIYRLHHGSNIWRIDCSVGPREIDFLLYVFTDFSLEQIANRIQHRLDSAL